MTSHNLGSFYPFTIRAQFLLTSVAAFFSWFLQDSIQQSAIFAKKHNTDICCQDTQRFLSMSPGCQGNGEERIAIENYYKMKQAFCYLVFSNSWDGFETCYSWTMLDSWNVHLFLPSDFRSAPTPVAFGRSPIFFSQFSGKVKQKNMRIMWTWTFHDLSPNCLQNLDLRR